jgi:hypothetical protein
MPYELLAPEMKGEKYPQRIVPAAYAAGRVITRSMLLVR